MSGAILYSPILGSSRYEKLPVEPSEDPSEKGGENPDTGSAERGAMETGSATAVDRK
jgi:hypothetical protein